MGPRGQSATHHFREEEWIPYYTRTNCELSYSIFFAKKCPSRVFEKGTAFLCHKRARSFRGIMIGVRGESKPFFYEKAASNSQSQQLLLLSLYPIPYLKLVFLVFFPTDWILKKLRLLPHQIQILIIVVAPFGLFPLFLVLSSYCIMEDLNRAVAQFYPGEMVVLLSLVGLAYLAIRWVQKSKARFHLQLT